MKKIAFTLLLIGISIYGQSTTMFKTVKLI
ncbi:Hypothetical protein LEPBI_I0141 [Leptospira biflexa serovar Patoc strain 'Patoc 1 (Paris)']|uniref:Uncharacterized protein n=1 Tax=Leptospira biflexa serovar Patoc (strain Patoc 1 / ATCC 23582 / Paris) TaxID=456481 RepID=B0SJV7_LEPBP|nr:Hypothetical protein LEPBI_I0141 [Leptospira biflexa serovar Patoc strain 'Patoc 1 (Paris)']